MKRDPQTIREILSLIEEDDGDPLAWVDVKIPEKDESQVSYHIELLYEAGYIDATDCSTMDGHDWRAKRLTWEGHELLDAIRDETVWRKTTERLSKAGGWTLPILQTIATDILKKQLGMK